jgi:Arc/MetJ-type ribon-helix-helix transcriptional regulator
MGPGSDLIGELSEWRNISDVVRQSFKALNEAMKLQGERIKQLEAQLEECVHVGELKQIQLSLSNKPTFAEVNRITGELMKEVNVTSKWEELRAQVQTKADKSEVRELYAGLTVANSKLNNRAMELNVKELQVSACLLAYWLRPDAHALILSIYRQIIALLQLYIIYIYICM